MLIELGLSVGIGTIAFCTRLDASWISEEQAFLLYVWVRRLCYGRRRVAAALVTVAVISIALLPLGGMLTLAGVQLVQAGREFVSAIDLPEDTEAARDLVDPQQNPPIASALKWLRGQVSEDTLEPIPFLKWLLLAYEEGVRHLAVNPDHQKQQQGVRQTTLNIEAHLEHAGEHILRVADPDF